MRGRLIVLESDWGTPSMPKERSGATMPHGFDAEMLFLMDALDRLRDAYDAAEIAGRSAAHLTQIKDAILSVCKLIDARSQTS